MTSYRGDQAIDDIGHSAAGAIKQFMEDRQQSKGLDTAIQVLASAHSDDQEFQKKFLPHLEKAGGMSLTQKQGLLGTVAGYLGQRFERQKQDQSAKWQNAQIDNQQADNRRADAADQDRREGENATGTVVRNFFNAPMPVVDRMRYALNSTTVAPRHLPQVLRALQGMEGKAPDDTGLAAGQVVAVGDAGHLVGVGGKGRPYLVPPKESGGEEDYGRGRAVTDGDGKVMDGYVWVRTNKGGGQIVMRNGAKPDVQVVDGKTYLRQPGGKWTFVPEPKVDPMSRLYDELDGDQPGKPAPATNAPPAGISWKDFLEYRR